MPNYNIPFSPPDITEAEIAEVADTQRKRWHRHTMNCCSPWKRVKG